MKEIGQDIEVTSDVEAQNPLELTVDEYKNILMEVRNQPRFRTDCDIAADYYDGNQLDSETLRFMKEMGFAPIIENLVAPTIDAVIGLEAKTRKDWKVTAQAEDESDDLASALNQKLFEAEKMSHADRANSEAFKAQTVTGIGWVEVGRETDPFKEPYRVEYVSRNEIFYDMKAKLPDKSDAMFMMRSRWYDVEVLKKVFPSAKELLTHVNDAWTSLPNEFDGNASTGLARAFNTEKSITLEEQEWRETSRNRLRLNAVWYRRYVTGNVIRLQNGIVAEFDKDNREHVMALMQGAQIRKANYSKIRLSWWVGAHKLADMENPFQHGRYPYIPFVGKEEDLSGIPYGLVRAMIPMQDEINARNTKSIWLLAAKRITMTEGVSVDDKEIVRQEAGRPDAIHTLNPEALRNGGMFKVETDFQLNDQQYKTLQDKRLALKAVAGVYAAFEGASNNQSGVALHAATEQSSQTLATIYDNYEYSRALVGELLLSLIIEDIGDNPEKVVVKNDMGGTSKTVGLNIPQEDGSISNNIRMIRAKVALSDVPSTSSFKAQTLQYFTQLNQGLPPQYQAVLVKFMMKLTDISAADKQEIVDAIAKINGEEVNKPPANDQEALAQEQAREQAALQAQMMQESMQLDLEAKRAAVDKLKAEAQKLASEATPNTAEIDKLKAKLEEAYDDLEQAATVFDAKREEIEANRQVELEKARIQANADIRVAEINAEKDLEFQQLKADMDEIERLLQISPPSDTGKQEQPSTEAVFLQPTTA